MVSRGEKKMIHQSAKAMYFCDELKRTFSDLEGEMKFTQTKRDLSTIETYLQKVNIEILKQGETRDEIIAAGKSIDRMSEKSKKVRLNITLNEEDEVHAFFSRHAIIYMAIRDLLNYYQENPDKLPKKVTTWLKTCFSIINRLFKKQAKDADLGWDSIKFLLDNKIDKYKFEARAVFL